MGAWQPLEQSDLPRHARELEGRRDEGTNDPMERPRSP